MTAILSNESAFEAPSRSGEIWARFLKDKVAVFCSILLLLIVAAAILAPWLPLADPNQGNLRFRSALPNDRFWLGADEQGRDILSRLIFGARQTLLMSGSGLLIGGSIGCLLGILAAYFRRLDSLIMRTNDVLMSFPTVFIAFALVGLVGGGTGTVVVSLAIAMVPSMARIARGAASVIVNQEYVLAGRAIGLGSMPLMFRYVLRNCWSSIFVYATLSFAHVILAGASLSFLGLGPRLPQAELGSMVAAGRNFFLLTPHISMIPCFTIFIIVLNLNILGDALRDIIDPKLHA